MRSDTVEVISYGEWFVVQFNGRSFDAFSGMWLSDSQVYMTTRNLDEAISLRDTLLKVGGGDLIPETVSPERTDPD
jgi:hypothetical protein